MTTTCTKCRANLWDDELAANRRACCRCEHDTFTQLRAIPAMFRRLNTTGALMKTSSGEHIGSPSKEAPAPLKIGILDLTATGGAVTRLQAIEDAWRAALGWSMGSTRHHADIDGITQFLINNLRWACENYDEIAHDLHTIRRLHNQIHSLDTGAKPARQIRVHCATADCAGRMLITMDSEHRVCPECETEYDREALMRLDSDYGPNTIRQAA